MPEQEWGCVEQGPVVMETLGSLVSWWGDC
jgi:hypothetical protein